MCLKNAISFESIKKKYPRAYISPPKAELITIVEYITKKNTAESHPVSYGNLPQKGKRTDLETIYDMLVDENTLKDIRTVFPSQYMRYKNHIKSIQQELLSEKIQDKWIEREVIYIYGDTGLGKTRYVMEKYGYTNCYRVTNYKHPFDTYNNEPVIIFEEFRSSLKIEEMFIYLDGYPTILPARYNDKVALFEKVYIVTNVPLFDQYKSIQKNHPETFKAFIRRINKVHFLVPIRKSNENHKLIFDNPIDALHFSNVLDNVILGIKPKNTVPQWFDENKYIAMTRDEIKELNKSYDLTGYSYRAPEFKHKDEALYEIAKTIKELGDSNKNLVDEDPTESNNQTDSTANLSLDELLGLND